MKKTLINSGLLLFSILITLCFAELIVKFFYPQDLSGTWRTLSPKGYLLNKASVTSRHQLGDRIIYYHLNSHHLRSREVDTSRHNILVFGDSFTFGWLLDEKDTYVSILQKYANDSIDKNISLLNAGAGGWGTLDFLDYLNEFGDAVQPDMVIVFMNGDDIGRSIHRDLFFAPDNFSFKVKSLFSNWPFYTWLLEHSHLVQIMRKTFVYTKMADRKEAKAVIPGSTIGEEQVSTVIPFAKKIFSDMNDWCKKRNISLVITTTGWIFHTEEHKNDPTAIFLSKADSIFSEMEIPFYDITPENRKIIEQNFSQYIIEGDNHPNEKGALLIANASWKVLKPHMEENYREKH